MNQTVLIGIPCLMVGGTEIQTLRLVQALSEGGYNCITVCYFEYDQNMVNQFTEAGSKVICLSPEGKRPNGVLKTFRFLLSGLKRVVSDYHPAVAHVQYMAPGALPIIILKRLRVKTIVATIHTDASIYKNLYFIHFIQRHCVRVFTCVTEIAERSFFGCSKLYNDDIPLKKRNHLTIHNCLAPNYGFRDCSESDIKENDYITIGVVARLESIKGVDFVLPAFAAVRRRYPNCRLVIVGDGKMKELMERQQKEYGLDSSSVLWTGRLAYDNLPSLYGSMDIVWVPSRSEGFGLSAIEAMSQGCPVVAANTGGLPEVVHDGANGALFAPCNPDDLAIKTIDLIENKELILTLRNGAVDSARNFCFERYGDNIRSLYDKLLV